ncbi:hypothetical protein F5144DRAFT_492055 [Chaetomium tenue]|uniref:Uncharacterized protein n=1 Tax=Chaetomium tenue TaxID=1854479 RepID=A0ACB7P5M7_9PEZI|nr:hypothetical protein F5144DRAFT_492055 [Chaetomium globosum]
MSAPQKKVRTPPNCGPDVMGDWSSFTRRIWRATQFRFETLFEVPVIFVCRPSNAHGPIKDKPVHFVSGTQESLAATKTLLSREEEALRRSMRENPRHSTYNERASWLRLLSQLQSMERESHEWQRRHYRNGPSMRSPCVEFSNHTLAIAVQAERRSWDKMPVNVQKPYAKTTISGLLEIAAMMGIHWKEFDRPKDLYRAEGNGYMLTGTRIPDLGVIFTFQISGKAKFQESRVIPVDEVKELCCGSVPTLFQDMRDNRRIELPAKELRDLSFLQLGSINEIVETMTLMDCNTDTSEYFRTRNSEYKHLFPVLFELVGMLGKTMHIRNSAFRMLPNPTPYRWDKRYFNIPQLVREYRENITDSNLGLPQVPQVQQLVEDADILSQTVGWNAGPGAAGYSIPMLNTLHDVLDRCDSFLQKSNRDLVRVVVREHFQEVIQLVDGEGEVADEDNSEFGGQRAQYLSEVTAASPEMREVVFMELYFDKVLSQVRKRAATSYARRKATRYAQSAHPYDHSFANNREMSAAVPVPRVTPPPPPDLESDAAAIWCTLVLRMVCWLLLHDFDRNDVQIPKSELLGSRLPVYIA